jgi:DNA-binding transcriptional ArsR family regulator
MLKKHICKRHAEVCKVFANSLRVEIIEALAEHDRSTTELAEMIGVSQVNISQALSMMRGRNIVISTRDGNSSSHALADPRIKKVFFMMREMLLDNLQRSGELARDARSNLKSVVEAEAEGPS